MVAYLVLCLLLGEYATRTLKGRGVRMDQDAQAQLDNMDPACRRCSTSLKVSRDGRAHGQPHPDAATDGKVSAATIFNVMQDLEHLGLLDSPHISAGRIPTQLGLRMFVDGVLEVGDPDEADQRKIQSTLDENDSVTAKLDRLTSALSGLTHGASLVLAPKQSAPIKHIEFVPLAQDRALAVLVYANGNVENRVFQTPLGQTPSQLREAVNFLNAVGQGKTLEELQTSIAHEITNRRSEIDVLTADLVKMGVAVLQDDQATPSG